MTSLQEAIEGWAKQTDMYEQAIKERDDWKACAEELAGGLVVIKDEHSRTMCEVRDIGYSDGLCLRPSCFELINNALTRFNKLKGQTK
jgi:hypothetical protein